MKEALCTAIAAALLLPALAMAQSAFNGTWKVDLQKSQLSQKPAVMTLKDGVYHCVSCVFHELTVRADGRDHTVMGHPGIDAISVQVLNDHSIRLTSRNDGKTVAIQTMTVAPDGKTATMTIASYRGKAPVTGRVVLDRVAKGPAGENAIAGAWRTATLSDVSANGLSFTYRIEGGAVSLSSPTGMSYTAKMNGAAAPVHGVPGHVTVSVHRLDSHAFRETFTRDGKMVGADTMTVAANGKTLKAVDHDYLRKTTSTFVADKQ
ncbi:MAG: hypothetical protein ACREP0_06230 [Rhodanobacteraceae bacterium]